QSVPPRDPRRRGRDLNPRRTFQHVRDFQSRSLDHSDTSPSRTSLASSRKSLERGCSRPMPETPEWGCDGSASVPFTGGEVPRRGLQPWLVLAIGIALEAASMATLDVTHARDVLGVTGGLGALFGMLAAMLSGPVVGASVASAGWTL